jgi:hypothetical protein
MAHDVEVKASVTGTTHPFEAAAHGRFATVVGTKADPGNSDSGLILRELSTEL